MAAGGEVDVCESGAGTGSAVIDRRRLSAVVLAGGASSRMETAKALLAWRGEPVAVRLAGLFVEAVGEAWVVLGHEAGAIAGALPGVARVRVVVNARPERGMLSSLQCGLRAALAEGAEGVFFLPVDYAAVSGETVAAMRDAWWARAGAQVMLPREGGRRGHPVLVSRAVAEEVLRLPAEGAAHEVIRRDAGRVEYVDVADAAIHRDADDAEAWAALVKEFGG